MSQVFAFQDHPVRTVTESGQIWFVGSDIAKLLGYARPDKEVRRICKYVKLFKPTNLVGWGNSPRGFLIIPESDVWRLIVHSTLPKAQEVEKWIMGEVLPAIRQTGAYELSGHRCKSALEGQNGAPKALPESNVSLDPETAAYLAGKYPQAREAFMNSASPQADAKVELESHFQRIRSLVREINEHERSIYAIIKGRRGDILKTLDARYSVYVNMHTTMDRMFFSIDYALEAAEAHAKSMCVMCRV